MEMLVNDKRVNYQDSGRGEALVLLHGFTETLDMWDDFSSELSADYRVVRIDLPGHGGSECAGEVHTMAFMADVVKAVLDHLSIRKCLVVGHSMGGYVALAFARKYGFMLRGLGLFHSSAFADTVQVREARMKAMVVVRENHHDFLTGFIPDLFAPENRERFKEDIAMLLERAKRMPKEGVMASLMGMRERPDATDVLASVNCPVMFIAGHKDSRIPVKSVQEQILFPDISYALFLKNAGHMGFLEERDRAVAFVRHFLSSC